ncbi:hypothetical protein EDD21DRAFT_230313 [Dissophora ornata]|nr:hypothetical protein EDD21DRAFT_230313 [Dissophora ornata]
MLEPGLESSPLCKRHAFRICKQRKFRCLFFSFLYGWAQTRLWFRACNSHHFHLYLFCKVAYRVISFKRVMTCCVRIDLFSSGGGVQWQECKVSEDIFQATRQGTILKNELRTIYTNNYGLRHHVLAPTNRTAAPSLGHGTRHQSSFYNSESDLLSSMKFLPRNTDLWGEVPIKYSSPDIGLGRQFEQKPASWFRNIKDLPIVTEKDSPPDMSESSDEWRSTTFSPSPFVLHGIGTIPK